jgi:hypothetical protein
MDVRFSGRRFLAGSVAALVAAVALVRWGAAPLRVLGDALLWRVGEPLPTSLAHRGATLACSLLFGVATLLALQGLFRLARVAAFSSLALILVIASGATSTTGGAGLYLAAARQSAALGVIGASANAPTEAQAAAAVEYAQAPAQWGFAGLLAGALLLVVLSGGSLELGGTAAPARAAAWIAGRLAVVCLAGFALLWAATWWPMRGLAEQFRAAGPLHPGELAGQISATIQCMRVAALSLFGYGALLVLFGILLRRAARATR